MATRSASFRPYEELEELADFIRVHEAVDVLAGSRETRLEVSKRWVEAVHDFLEELSAVIQARVIVITGITISTVLIAIASTCIAVVAR
jgi:hypothetical protein